MPGALSVDPLSLPLGAGQAFHVSRWRSGASAGAAADAEPPFSPPPAQLTAESVSSAAHNRPPALTELDNGAPGVEG
ncbi:hypothetical protein SMD11_2373 [Streptomyces albireticuli]|uniref:Uncharacterized protein n=1 Tax=Streptomyces albireticuli TaxID=1940 RepID=A0A1Z2L140_9ACTN|nr:hypothetical protein SMD11_2373 [Streptomyces albireticuli]